MPNKFEVFPILTACSLELKLLDHEKYHALFGQYFRFNISAQQPYSFGESHQFTHGLCVALETEYQDDQVNRLCLMPFYPVLMFKGSKYRLIDSLFETCLVLSRDLLIDQDCGSHVMQYTTEGFNPTASRPCCVRDVCAPSTASTATASLS